MSRKGAANFAGYFRLFRNWFWLGWPAFAGVIAIFRADHLEPQAW